MAAVAREWKGNCEERHKRTQTEKNGQTILVRGMTLRHAEMLF
jgi:hypothetical protein